MAAPFRINSIPNRNPINRLFVKQLNKPAEATTNPEKRRIKPVKTK